MKTLTTLLSLIITVFVMAQEAAIPTEIVVNERVKTLDESSANAFVVRVQGGDKEIRKSLKDYFENKYTISFKGMGNSFNTVAVNNSRLSDQVFTIYIRIVETETANDLIAFMSFGDGKYANSQEFPSEADRMKKALSDFTREFYVSRVQEMMEEKSDEIEKLNKDLAKVIDDKSDLEKDVAKVEKKVAKNQSKISKAQLKLEKYQAKIKSEEEEIAELSQENNEYAVELEKSSSELTAIDAKIKSENENLKGSMEELNTLKLKLSKLLSF